MQVNKKLKSFRKWMKKSSIDAIIIPTNDPHNSEYVPDHWKQREWISGFTGSAGIVVITKNHAGLWTDSRYFIQAEQELADSEFELHKVVKQNAPEHVVWLMQHLNSKSTVGIDASLFSVKQVDYLSEQCDTHKMKLNNVDLISAVWEDRPTLPINPIVEHRVKYAGYNRKKKWSMIRSEMSKKSADTYLMTALDDIAWAFNLRGSDVDCNPVFLSYAVLGMEKATLFVDDRKLSEELRSKLEKEGVSIKSYSNIKKSCKKATKKRTMWVDPSNCNAELYNTMCPDNIVEGQSIVQQLKAIKNKTEIEHLRNAHIKDGVALTKAFMWLENNKSSGEVSEAIFAKKLAECRREQEGYFGESFDAIVGFKGNGAIVHYRPDEENSAYIKGSGVLLVDSGGQYQDGTTDITRTIVFGRASAEVKKAYTSVLKGHIGLDMAKFPHGTTGGQLDILARQHLWKYGLNFLHGTGHGVGFFLNVHEGPQGFAPALTGRSAAVFKEGMYTSNEPGYYKTDEYGIRIENLILTIASENKGYLEFENITLFPIEKKLITQSQLTRDEVKWINDYHKKVYSALSPHLDSEQKKWLKEKCSAL